MSTNSDPHIIKYITLENITRKNVLILEQDLVQLNYFRTMDYSSILLRDQDSYNGDLHMSIYNDRMLKDQKVKEILLEHLI